MYRDSDIIQEADGYRLAVGSFIGSAHSNPLSKFGSRTSPSIVFKDGVIEHRIIEARATAGKEISILFQGSRPHPAAELGYGLRSEALVWISRLSQAIQHAGNADLPFLDKIIPLYCIYFTDEGEVILLSQQLADIIHFCLEDSESFSQTFALSWVPFNDSIKLSEELVQLLYFAQTGAFPFSDDRIRCTGARAYIRLELTGSDPAIARIIDRCLRLRGEKAKLDIDSVISELEAIGWTCPDHAFDTLQAEQAFKKLDSKARKAMFWKKKGWIVALCAAAAITIGYFVTNYCVKEFGPPDSAGMSEEEIVAYYYQAQNDLDTEHLTDTLVHRVKSPVFNEVTALYVTRATRLGYENIDCVVSPEKWIESGKGPITSSAMIYGTTDLSMRRIDNDTLEATVSLYSNTDYFNEGNEEDLSLDAEAPAFTEVYVYRQVQQFDFVPKYSWEEISAITEISLELTDHFQVPYSAKQTGIAQPQT